MGNDHSRKPLLPIFKHLEKVSIEELEEVYNRYRRKFKSPPFLTRQMYSDIFFGEDKVEKKVDPNDADNYALKERQRKDDFLANKKKTDPIADLQFAYLDRFKRQTISAIDIFAGISLICHESMDGRLKFAFKLVDFGRLNKINHAELTLMISAALRGIARFKGIKDAPMYESDTIARRLFIQSEVNLRAGEGVGDYKEGGVTLKQVIAFCRKDVKSRALLDNIDAGAYLSGLLQQHQDMFSELIDIEGAIEMKRRRENVEKGVQKIASQNLNPSILLKDKEKKNDQEDDDKSTNNNDNNNNNNNNTNENYNNNEASNNNNNNNEKDVDDTITNNIPPGIALKSKNNVVNAYKEYGVYSANVVSSLEHFRVSLLSNSDNQNEYIENSTIIANIGLKLVSEENTSIVPYDPEQQQQDLTDNGKYHSNSVNNLNFQTEDEIQEALESRESLGVWKVMKNDEKGRKVYQHLITGEIVPEVPPYDSRDAERVLENKATKYIYESVGVRDLQRKNEFLNKQMNTWWVSADDFYACTFAAGLRLRKVTAEKSLKQLTSKIPPEQENHVVPGILDPPTSTEEVTDENNQEMKASSKTNAVNDQAMKTGNKKSVLAIIEANEKMNDGDDDNEVSDEEEEDEDEENKVYFSKFQEWLTKETLKNVQRQKEEQSNYLKDVVKRRMERDRMILKRRMRRFVKQIRIEEEKRLLKEQEEARLQQEKDEDGGNELVEDDEFAALPNEEKAFRRAHHRWAKLRVEQDNFVLPQRSRNALDDMLAGYTVQGALDLAEERKGMLDSGSASTAKNVMAEFQRMLHNSDESYIENTGEDDDEGTYAIENDDGENNEGKTALEVLEERQAEQDEKNRKYLQELETKKKKVWEYDTDDEDDDSKVAKHLDWKMSLSLERRAVWMQMETRRKALSYMAWSLDRSDFNKWRRRYKRIALGWEDYPTEFEAETTTRYQEDDQSDHTCGPRKWSLTAQIDPPYKTFHIPGHGKKDIDDPDNALVSESEDEENSGDENENLEEEIVLSEDSESDDDDLPPPPPKPKLVIELDLNRGNPDATGVLEQMDKEKKEQPIGDDGTHDLFQDRRRKKNRTLFSLRTLLMRAYGKLPIQHNMPDEKTNRKTESDKIKHFGEYSAIMEAGDRDDEMEESDMIADRRAGFYIEIKCNKAAKVKDVHLIADSIAAFLEIPSISKAYSAFAHSPSVERVVSYGEVCIRIGFLLYKDADPFVAFARGAGLKVGELFSEELPTGIPGSFNSKKRGAENGGIQLFNTRLEVNVDIGEIFDLTLPFVEHHTNTVKWEKQDAKGPLAPVLSGLAKTCVVAMHKLFDEDKDKALSYREINRLNAACRNPLFETPKEYMDSIAEDRFDSKVADVGIGLTVKGLQQAYSLGEGDLGRDMALLNMGSLSHYLKATLYCNFDCTESFGRRLMDPTGAPTMQGRTNSTMQKYLSMLIRYVRGNRASMRYPGMFKLLNRYFNCSYNLNEEDGSAKPMTTIKEWLAWLFGHPGAIASFILSIRHTIKDDVEEMLRFIQKAVDEGWEDSDEDDEMDDKKNAYNLNRDEKEEEEENMEELEAKAERQDSLDAARILTRLYELGEDNIEELTSIVVVSEDLSLRAVISGLDIVRIFYDLPAKIPEETPAEKAYRLKKEQKKAKRERDKAAIAAIREKKKNQKKTVKFAQ